MHIASPMVIRPGSHSMERDYHLKLRHLSCSQILNQSVCRWLFIECQNRLCKSVSYLVSQNARAMLHVRNQIGNHSRGKQIELSGSVPWCGSLRMSHSVIQVPSKPSITEKVIGWCHVTPWDVTWINSLWSSESVEGFQLSEIFPASCNHIKAWWLNMSNECIVY